MKYVCIILQKNNIQIYGSFLPFKITKVHSIFIHFFFILILHISFKFKFLSLKQKGEKLDFFYHIKLIKH